MFRFTQRHMVAVFRATHGHRACLRVSTRLVPFFFFLAVILFVSPSIAAFNAFQESGAIDPSLLKEVETWGFTQEEFVTLVRRYADLDLKQNKLVLQQEKDAAVAVISEAEALRSAEEIVAREFYLRRASIRNLSPARFRQQGLHTRAIQIVQNELDDLALRVEKLEANLSAVQTAPTQQNSGYRPQPGDKTRVRDGVNEPGRIPPDQQQEINRQATAQVNAEEGASPESAGTTVKQPAASSQGTGGSSAGSTTQAPSSTTQAPRRNPNYTGPPDMNDPHARGDWKRPPRSPNLAGTLLVVTNLETIAKCREDGVPAQDCLCQIMVQNGVAASAAIAVQLLSKGTVVVLELAGQAAASIQLTYQTARLLYNLESWAAAEWNRYQVERDRAAWTDRNLKVRDLPTRIEAFRSRINSALDPLVTTIKSGCERLEVQAGRASESGPAARDEVNRLPLPEAIAAYKQHEDESYERVLRQRRLEGIADQVRQASDQVRKDVSAASAAAEDCRKAESAQIIADKYAAAKWGLQAMRKLSDEARTLGQPSGGAESGFQQARTVLMEAFAARDRIGRLASELASYEQMENWATGVDRAVQQLQEQGARLINEVHALRGAYPDELTAEDASRFDELEQVVLRLQVQSACNANQILRHYSNGLGQIADARLEAENRLRPVDLLYADLSRLDPGEAVDLNTLLTMVEEAEKLVLDRQDLLQASEKCRQLAAGNDFANEGTETDARSESSGNASSTAERTQARPPADQDTSRPAQTRQDPEFSDAGTTVSRSDRSAETVTYFERPWMPASWRTSGNSTEVRVNIYEAASRLGWAAALAEFTDGTADPIIADHLRAASNHALAVNRNAFGPFRPWPDFQQITFRHEEWARHVAEGSRTSRDYFRKGLSDTLLGHGQSLARALAYQAAGQLEQRENCDSYYFRIGYHLAYAAQALNLAAEGKANNVSELWIRRVINRGHSSAQSAANYIQELRQVRPATGYCIDLLPAQGAAYRATSGNFVPGENAGSAIQAWNEAIALLSGTGLERAGACSGELEGTWIHANGSQDVVRYVKKGDSYEGIFTHVNPDQQRMGHQPGRVYEWLQKVDDRNYQGKYLAHRWPGHQGDTWPLGVVVFGDYFVRGLGVWRRVRPDEISKIQLVREEGRSEFFIIPGYPRIRDANTAPDCRKGPIPTDRPAEDGGNSIRLLNQIPR